MSARDLFKVFLRDVLDRVEKEAFTDDDETQLITRARSQLKSEILDTIEGMKVRHLRSPRSWGDGEIVDNAPGYNQALSDLKGKIEQL